MTWYVRRASIRDKPALEALCREAVGPEDYVIGSLQDTILRSVVHIALGEKDRLVGMMAYVPCVDGSAWLSKARTHPDFRRQGVAHAIIDSFAGLARVGNVPTLRLWSEATNEEGLASFAAAGFKEVARFARVTREALPHARTPSRLDSASGGPRSTPCAFTEDLWRKVTASAFVAKGNGYVHHDNAFLPASRPVAFALAAKGVFRAWNGNLLAVSKDGEREEEMWFTAWAGDLPELLSEAGRLASEKRRSHTQTFLPNDPELLREAEIAGFNPASWGKEAVLAELSISPGHLRRRVRPTYGELAATRSGHGHAQGEDDGLGWARWNR